MAKKGVPEKFQSPNKLVSNVSQKKSTKKEDINKILIENFVSLQRVMTNLSVRFDNLSTQISKLLELFEISAKTIAEKTPHSEENHKGANKDMMEKIDSLLEQNKVIARGLTLIHETNSSKGELRQPLQMQRQPMPPPQNQQRQMPRSAPPRSPVQEQKSNRGFDKYQKSMSPNSQNEPEN